MAPGQGGYRQINKALNICAFEEYLESQQKTLPTLPDVEQISPRFTLQGTNTFIVGTGSERLLVDTGQGIPDWADLIHDTLARQGISLSHVLLTHWHGDHTGGALHTPGHSSDHMCFILEEEQAMFTGDNILGHGTSAVEHLSTWMDTLYKMHNLRIKIKGELAQKLQRERQDLKALVQAKHFKIAHQERSKGSVTVKQLVTTMYGNGVGAGVRELALEPFIDEVLRKLAEDGAVAFEIRGGSEKVVCP
ncbi:metallo-beta-lactamase type thioesterase tpcB [Aspergillus thermomutatus]|uniref:Metallo-beta-lactamase domain-containing protein n=1 Tax=Aspergillus thermomutatus TaxID=41047 RepID=A0A397HES5_ASPTH|nr:uncharacterized protein CDV56_104816 [Aspergillus thermomutatus]RHZ59793.1 hypothetical protein CDV56_104816 [Aspergillus thermomutatus]